MTYTESEIIEKIPTGIVALDSLLQGGLSKQRIAVIIGDIGTGKSVLCMQIARGAIQEGISSLYVVFEEAAQDVIANIKSFEWDLAEHLGEMVHVVEAKVEDDVFDSDAFDISGLLATVEARITNTGAKLVILDGLDALLQCLDSGRKILRELFRLRRWVTRQAVTIIVTAKEMPNDFDYSRNFGFIPFEADCVIRLSHARSDRVFVRRLRVVKHRGSVCFGTDLPFIIDRNGLDLAYTGTHRLDYGAVADDRVSTGVGELDDIIGGGYLRGSTTLISGAPGTAKTTLGIAFVLAACLRGEASAYFSFDESAQQIIRNMRSVGFDLQPHVDSGLLVMVGLRSSGADAHHHLISMQHVLIKNRPKMVVVDPISALQKAGGEVLAAEVMERLLEITHQMGITTLLTSLLEDPARAADASASGVSTIADTWISLTYHVSGGERNRALSIIKSRGTAHLHEVRELTLSAEGPHLTAAYRSAGEILMGAARIAVEQKEQHDAAKRKMAHDLLTSEARTAIEKIRDQIEMLTCELKRRSVRLQLLENQFDQEEQQQAQSRSQISAIRASASVDLSTESKE